MKTPDITELLETIRESVSSQTWSKAVELNRLGHVFLDSQRSQEQELIFHVKESHQRISHTVTLWPHEGDWHCDCNGPADPCAHTTSAAIALRKSQESQQPLPQMEREVAKVGYAFLRNQGNLSFSRQLMIQGRSLPLTTSLSAIVNGRVKGPEVSPSKGDLAIDNLLGQIKEGNLPPLLWTKLWPYLTESPLITLDDHPITCHPEQTGVEAWIEDNGGGVRLYGKQSSDIQEPFKNGVALCRASKENHQTSIQILKLLRQPQLTPPELEMLARGKLFGQKEMIELYSQILPQLSKKLPVRNLTKGQTQQVSTKPRLILESSYQGETLLFQGIIVYGDPEMARLKQDRLICHRTDLVPKRDISQERELQSEFQKHFQTPLNTTIALAGADAVRMATQLQEDSRWRKKLAGDGFTQFRILPRLIPQVSFSQGSQGFRLDLGFVSQGEHLGGKETLAVNPNRLLQAFLNQQSVVPLMDGGWAEIPRDWLRKHGQKLADLLSARRERDGEVPKALTYDIQSFLAEEKPDLEVSDIQLSSLELLDDQKMMDVWNGVQAELRGYQKEGIRWLATLKRQGIGALLADDMGLGKTLQTIAILEKRSLIVAPTSVLDNWAKEIRRFRPSLTVSLFHGSQRHFDPHSHVVITSYALLRLELDRLSQETWAVLILDESQAIKNPESQVAKASFQVPALFRVSVTGTPVENHLSDLWSQFHFLNEGLLGSYRVFYERYGKPIQNGAQDVSDHLRQRLAPFIKRRLKSQVAPELPPRSEMILNFDLSEDEQSVYQAVQLASQSSVVEKLQRGEGVMQALELLLRLRQAACHSALIPGQSAATSSKLELLLEELDKANASGHKALVFSQWTSFMDLLEEPLGKKGISFGRIDGSTQNRSQIVSDFQNTEKYQVLLLSLKAAGVGLNLTAADHVYILDPWWNPAVENQAADRSHRIGQQNPVFVYKLVAKNTVEEKIIQLQTYKKQLAESILEGGQIIEQLSHLELLSLLT